MILTIRSQGLNAYSWELIDGPNGVFRESGRAPDMNQLLIDVAAIRVELSLYAVGDLDSDPTGTVIPHPSLYSAP